MGSENATHPHHSGGLKFRVTLNLQSYLQVSLIPRLQRHIDRREVRMAGESEKITCLPSVPGKGYSEPGLGSGSGHHSGSILPEPTKSALKLHLSITDERD